MHALWASARLGFMRGKGRSGSAQRSIGKAAGRKLKQAASKRVRNSAQKPVVLLSGGNPQIAKGEGDASVQAWIAAAPGWKCACARRLDELIERSVPGVKKAVKWNSPFYGVEGQGWFLALHIFTRYVKVLFFRGVALKPPPPGATAKSGEARWLDIHEAEVLDDAQLEKWVRQAAAIPGWMA